jgi:MFS family permease
MGGRGAAIEDGPEKGKARLLYRNFWAGYPMPQRARVNRDAARAVLPPIPPRDTGTGPVSARATPRTPDDDRRPSARSLRGLDGLNFLMADVRDGLGPYLSVYLKGAQHWQPGDIGIAMAASSLSAALCQIPAGLLVDALRAKRLLVAGSGVTVAVGCMLIASFPHLVAIIAAQIMIGAASAVIPPALAALSLGLVGRRRMDGRISRNESFNHAGNFVAAALAGTLGQWLGYDWIFYLVCAFAVGSAAVVNLIKSSEIDHDLARGGAGVDPESGTSAQHRPIPIRDLLRHRDLMVFLLSVVLFHFGNAAMLPMAGQVLAQTHPGWDTISLSGCIIAAQFVMVAIAWAVGKAMAAGYGRKTIFLVALAVLPVRGLLFSFTANPFGVIAIQLLDGVAAGIFGVIAVIIAADVTRGTGRFNLAQGLVALSIGVGAGLSNLVAGYIVQWFGYPVGFLSLAVIAVAALVFFAALMPETRDLRDRPAREARRNAEAAA